MNHKLYEQDKIANRQIVGRRLYRRRGRTNVRIDRSFIKTTGDCAVIEHCVEHDLQDAQELNGGNNARQLKIVARFFINLNGIYEERVALTQAIQEPF